MVSLFFTSAEDGSFLLTTAGKTLFVIILFALLICVALISTKKEEHRFNTKQLIYAAACIALAFVASNIKIYRMPQGGSITLFSMLFICLAGYFYGPVIGIISGVAYGLLQMMVDPYIVSLPQLLIDYVMAFGALGIAGFFHKSRSRFALPAGYICGVLGRFIFAVLSGVVFFGQYAPEGQNVWIYSAGYNGIYLAAEGALTFIVLVIPAVSSAIARIRTQANS